MRVSNQPQKALSQGGEKVGVVSKTTSGGAGAEPRRKTGDGGNTGERMERGGERGNQVSPSNPFASPSSFSSATSVSRSGLGGNASNKEEIAVTTNMKREASRDREMIGDSYSGLGDGSQRGREQEISPSRQDGLTNSYA